MAWKTVYSLRLLHTSARACRSRIVWNPDAKQFVRQDDASASPRQLAARARKAAQVSSTTSTTVVSPPSPPSAPVAPITSKEPEDQAAAARKRFQERKKYIRGQDDSTLKVDIASIFEGVGIPVRPIAPPNDTCCMSGCPRCVYDVWTADMQLYHEALEQAQRELRTKGIPETQWPKELKFGLAAEADAKGDALDKASKDVDNEIKDLDIYLRTFLQFERSLRRRRAAEQAKRIALQHVSQMSELPPAASAIAG